MPHTKERKEKNHTIFLPCDDAVEEGLNENETVTHILIRKENGTGNKFFCLSCFNNAIKIVYF